MFLDGAALFLEFVARLEFNLLELLFTEFEYQIPLSRCVLES